MLALTPRANAIHKAYICIGGHLQLCQHMLLNPKNDLRHGTMPFNNACVHMRTMPHASCSSSRHAAIGAGSLNIATCRRQAVLLSLTALTTALALGSGHASAKIVVPPPISKRSVRRSQQEGERRREELEQARGPVRETASGTQYREMEVGFGTEAQRGDTCDVAYEVFTQGGLYLDSVGFGMESKKDIGETVRITLDDSVPIAIRNAMRGMREGGKRRIVVPPRLGWTRRELLPAPSNAAAARRFWRYAEDNTPMLFEVELIRVFKAPR